MMQHVLGLRQPIQGIVAVRRAEGTAPGIDAR